VFLFVILIPSPRPAANSGEVPPLPPPTEGTRCPFLPSVLFSSSLPCRFPKHCPCFIFFFPPLQGDNRRVGSPPTPFLSRRSDRVRLPPPLLVGMVGFVFFFFLSFFFLTEVKQKRRRRRCSLAPFFPPLQLLTNARSSRRASFSPLIFFRSFFPFNSNQ